MTTCDRCHAPLEGRKSCPRGVSCRTSAHYSRRARAWDLLRRQTDALLVHDEETLAATAAEALALLAPR